MRKSLMFCKKPTLDRILMNDSCLNNFYSYKQINDEANKSENAWRPDNVALNNQAAHDRNIITNAKVKLEQELLKELQDDVEDLEKQVTALSYEIAENTANVKAKLQEE